MSPPNSADLEILLGVHSVEGVREVVETCGTKVLLVRLDGEVHAFYAPSYGPVNGIRVSRLRDEQWPFLQNHLCRLHGEEMEAADSREPLICNFLQGPPNFKLRFPDPREHSPRASIKHAWDSLSSLYPAPSIFAIDEGRDLIILEIGIDTVGSAESSRLIMPMSSRGRVLPDTREQVVNRPQRVPFRPNRILISGNPADWAVQDFRIGGRSQFAQAGSIPGALFAASSIDSFVSFDTAQLAMDITVTIEYIGSDPGGSVFTGALLGTGPIYPSVFFRWTPEGRYEPWLSGSLDLT